MISKNELKFLCSLQQKKYRREHQMFIVEGTKSVAEVLQSDFVVKKVYATLAWMEEHKDVFSCPISMLTEKECERVSSLQTTPEIFALVEMKEQNEIIFSDKCLVLDDIKDAGNLGTLIRTADWFGIKTIVCSEQTVELYNPKTIQASMGSFTHVHVFYTDLKSFLHTISKSHTIYGTFMEGNELNKVCFSSKSVVIIGNESKGISSELASFVQEKIYIARKADHTMDSLNAAIATAVVCYELTK